MLKLFKNILPQCIMKMYYENKINIYDEWTVLIADEKYKNIFI